MTVRRGAVHRQGVEAERRQRRHQLLAGERLMNGIPRSGMGQTKVEDFAGRQTGAAPGAIRASVNSRSGFGHRDGSYGGSLRQDGQQRMAGVGEPQRVRIDNLHLRQPVGELRGML